jgi:tyrosine decarboxylase / aspartate 1-decarboxylase
LKKITFSCFNDLIQTQKSIEMDFNTDLILLEKAIKQLKEGFSSFPDSLNDSNEKSIEEILLKVAERMQNNFPYFQPNYAGQMLKPPHAIARLAYMLSLYINPNNHALDGGRESSKMEKEVISKMAAMFGWKKYLGHLTSGGTFANLEALWVAGKKHPGKKILASSMAHYTHQRISSVLGLTFGEVSCDKFGRMDLNSLEKILKNGDVGTVVATFGTTGIGSIDPLCGILELQKEYQFRIHVDAAYGGYYILTDDISEYAQEQYRSINQADSIVVDPHKHGLQPYGCGCVLFKDREVGKLYKHDSPYTYFSSSDLHLGEISLECSRAGASAVALWATMELFPLIRNGEFAQNLSKCRKAATKLYQLIKADEQFLTLLEPELDIVVWAPKAKSLSEIIKLSNDFFHLAATKYNLHLALFNYPAALLNSKWNSVIKDSEYVTCLRSCLMKPEHFDFVDEMWQIILKCKEEMKK